MLKMTLTLITAMTVLLYALSASAGPFIVADPNPETDQVRWYKVLIVETGEEIVTDYGKTTPGGQMIVLDFAEHGDKFSPGAYNIEIKAVNLAGESPPGPFDFSMPSAAPAQTAISLAP